MEDIKQGPDRILVNAALRRTKEIIDRLGEDIEFAIRRPPTAHSREALESDLPKMYNDLAKAVIALHQVANLANIPPMEVDALFPSGLVI